MRLLIDDTRTNIAADIIARTFEDGIKALKENKIDVLYLDHDLGFNHYSNNYSDEKTGYDIMCWLEQNQQYLPTTIVCVSANPVGAKRINQVIEKLYKGG